MSAIPPFDADLAGLEMFSQADPAALPPRLRRALPRTSLVVSGNGAVTQNAGQGTATQPSQPQTLEQTLALLRKRSDDAYQRYMDAQGKDPDMSQIQEYAKRRSAEGQNAMLTSLAAQFAGPRFEAVQNAMLKQAMAARDPMKLGKGYMTGEGTYVADPFERQDAETRRALGESEFYQRQYGTLMSEAEKAEQKREEAQRRRDEAETNRQFRREMLSARLAGGADGMPGSFSQTGFTPEGQPIVTNSKNGMSYLIGLGSNGQPTYQPYQGAAIPKTTFDKNVTEAQRALASAGRADTLLNMVDKNPEAFGIRAQAVSMLPQAVQGRVGAMVLDKETLTNRAEILRQAAMEINDLYGAALSMGEQARANSFLPNKDDSPEVLIAKLRAARDWARQTAGSFGAGAKNAAQTRIGSNPAGNEPAQGGSAGGQKRIRFDANGNVIP